MLDVNVSPASEWNVFRWTWAYWEKKPNNAHTCYIFYSINVCGDRERQKMRNRVSTKILLSLIVWLVSTPKSVYSLNPIVFRAVLINVYKSFLHCVRLEVLRFLRFADAISTELHIKCSNRSFLEKNFLLLSCSSLFCSSTLLSLHFYEIYH